MVKEPMGEYGNLLNRTQSVPLLLLLLVFVLMVLAFSLEEVNMFEKDVVILSGITILLIPSIVGGLGISWSEKTYCPEAGNAT
jgi:uncharacterized membrane protein YphA (DoxX/SURF4 family)